MNHLRRNGFRAGTRLLALLLSLPLLLPGCGGRNEVVTYDEQPAPTRTITFFGNKYEPENVEIIEEILTDFMREDPDIGISYESLKGADYYEALEKRMASGQSDDVFMINHDTALAFSQAGQLADLSGLQAIPSFSDSVLSQMREADGSICWVPTTISAFGLYCNLDLLEEHHRQVPQTLPEWEETCAYFVGLGITPIVANNDISLKTLAIAKGFDPLYREGRQQEVFARINSGEESLSSYLREGFALAEDFCARGFIDREEALQTQKTSDDLTLFAQGNAPFLLTDAWAAGRVKAMEPGFAFQVVPYPVLKEGSVLVINPDTRLSVSADSVHPDAAMEFVSYFLRQENIQKFADNQFSFSPLKEGTGAVQTEIRSLVDSYRTETAVIGSDSLLSFPVWELTAEISRQLLAGGSLDEAMDWLDEQVRGSTGPAGSNGTEG